ncbi:MAG: fimbrial biogenesis chaperone [Luteimonas sp.]
MKKIVFTAALLLALCAPATASKMAVSPVVLRASTTQTIQMVHMANKGTTPTTYQVSVYSWRQKGEAEQIEPTREVMAYPPMLEVAPGATRGIRLVKLAPGPGTYRVVLRELPRKLEGSGIQRLMNYDLPLIFEDGKTSVALEASRKGSQLLITNTGSRPIQLTEIGADGHVWKQGMLGWLLPGGSKAFRFAAPGTVQVKADGKPLTLSVR